MEPVAPNCSLNIWQRISSWAAHRSYRKVFTRHYNVAVGDNFTKTCTALVMAEVKGNTVMKAARELPRGQRKTFLMLFECFLLWMIAQRSQRSRSNEYVVAVLESIQRHLSKHGYYEPEMFEEIWEAVQEGAPESLNPHRGEHDVGIAVPWTVLVQYCNSRDIELGHTIDLVWQMYVVRTANDMFDMVDRALAAGDAQRPRG